MAQHAEVKSVSGSFVCSEPMGYMLFAERMLETFLHAKKWLKPGGVLYYCACIKLNESQLFVVSYRKNVPFAG